MTKPLVEPTYPRTITQQGFGQRQLQRRPPIPATGGSNSEYAWAECTTAPTVPGPSASPVVIPWDIFLSTDTNVFDMPGGTGSTALQCKASGSYLFEIKVLFTDPPEGVSATFFGTVVGIDGSDGAWFAHNNFVYPNPPGCGETIGIRDFATAFLDQSGAFGPTKNAGIEMWNFCGPDCDLNVAYLKAVYVPSSNNLTSIF